MTRGFSKAIVWGCPLHRHTNSYVYAGFHKAFAAMGFDAYWLNEESDTSGMDFSNSLFLTEWQHAGNMPKRKDCKYVLHNCDPKDYEGLDVVHLQTYTDHCVDGSCVHNATNDAPHLRHAVPSRINDHGSWLAEEPGKRTLFQPWATDLLPQEIDLEWAGLPREREAYWVGTIGTRPYPDDIYSNLNEISAFRRACEENGIAFRHFGPGSVSFEENRRLIQRSYVAPAICGAEQCRVGCITCRIFKHVSYGHVGATNCRAAHDLLEGMTVFNPDTHALFHDAEAAAANKARVQDLMTLVKNKHTYVSRIETILSIL